MITGIDHIVIAAPSLDELIDTWGGLGFTVVAGGRHPYGSHNALIAFADGSYIELLGFYEDAPEHPWWDLVHNRGGGFVDFCMATDDIRADHAALVSQSVISSELEAGGRSRPDGYRVEWINNKVGGDYQGRIPFIIEDVTPREERLATERTHENGVTGIDRVDLVAYDSLRFAAIMGAVTGAEVRDARDESLVAVGSELRIGGHGLRYLEPAGHGALWSHLEAERPATFGVRFRAEGGARTFSLAETGGLRMAFV